MDTKTFNDKFKVEKVDLKSHRIARSPDHPKDRHEGDLVEELNLPQGKIKVTDITSVLVGG